MLIVEAVEVTIAELGEDSKLDERIPLLQQMRGRDSKECFGYGED